MINNFRFEISQTELAKRADIVSSNIDFKEKVMAACGDIIPRSYPEKKYVDDLKKSSTYEEALEVFKRNNFALNSFEKLS